MMLVSPIPIPIPGRAVIDLASQPLACCSLGSSPPSSSPLESRHHPSAPHRPERGALNVVNGTYTPPRTRPSSATRAGRMSLELVAVKGKLKRRRGRGGNGGGGGGGDSDDDDVFGSWWDGSGDGFGSGGSGPGGPNGGHAGYSGGDGWGHHLMYDCQWVWQVVCALSILNAVRFGAVAAVSQERRQAQQGVEAVAMG